jgi:hypothetical protein
MMSRHRHWKRWTIGASVALLLTLVAVLTWSPLLPWAANHYGFALPGDDGLPYRIYYAGRHYATQGMCARAGWCAGESRECETPATLETKLRLHRMWPLHDVSSIGTLFGPSYPILAGATPAGLTTVILYVPYHGCYEVYELEGGP